ncbi:MAG: dephospho-CoA kinase [Omnitrophica bacterium]|nr:dephospho-CoA kinase [Candidatus Omnitrophota bacterium]
MKRIGITGGLCAGKSTVASFFKDLGARVIDADKLVRDLYKKDAEIKKAIRNNFGKKVFTQGVISRKKLAGAVFANKRALQKLCRIIHPKVIKKIKDESGKSKRAVTVIDAPLLIEVGLHRAVDAVVVVRAKRQKWIRRGMARGLTPREAIKRQAAQMPLREKVKYADFVINNDKSRENTRKAVVKIWQEITRR